MTHVFTMIRVYVKTVRSKNSFLHGYKLKNFKEVIIFKSFQLYILGLVFRHKNGMHKSHQHFKFLSELNLLPFTKDNNLSPVTLVFLLPIIFWQKSSPFFMTLFNFLSLGYEWQFNPINNANSLMSRYIGFSSTRNYISCFFSALI